MTRDRQTDMHICIYLPRRAKSRRQTDTDEIRSDGLPKNRSKRTQRPGRPQGRLGYEGGATYLVKQHVETQHTCDRHCPAQDDMIFGRPHTR